MEEKKKTFIIEINGIKDSTENVEKLIDTLDKLDIKVKNSNTSKVVATTFDNFTQPLTNIVDLLKKIVEIISKTQPLVEAPVPWDLQSQGNN